MQASASRSVANAWLLAALLPALLAARCAAAAAPQPTPPPEGALVDGAPVERPLRRRERHV
jgi:hypothetical protein